MTVNPTLTTVTLIFLLHFLSGTVNADHDDKNGFHSIEKGTRKTSNDEPVDMLLFHDDVKVDGKLLPFPMATSDDLCYPQKGIKHAKFTITAFNVVDQDKGGLAFITDGGVDKHTLCLHLKSRRGVGYHFVIDIWGYYN